MGGGGRGGLRTENMPTMLVTLEVSQLDMSALKFRKPSKRLLMSVMAETHQSAMGPYVAMAAAGSALNAWTALFREALVVKVFWIVQATSGGLGDGGGGDGDGGGGLGELFAALGVLATANLSCRNSTAILPP